MLGIGQQPPVVVLKKLRRGSELHYLQDRSVKKQRHSVVKFGDVLVPALPARPSMHDSSGTWSPASEKSRDPRVGEQDWQLRIR